MEAVLDDEELLWKQKSRKDWLAMGDRNSRYFHSQVIKRRRRNKIQALKLSDGEWCYDEDKVNSEVVGFLKKNLYTDFDLPLEMYSVKDGFPVLELSLQDSLSRQVTIQEVHEALFEMAPLKAPGVDGLHAQFYQSQWDMIGDSLVSLVRNGFENGEVEAFFE